MQSDATVESDDLITSLEGRVRPVAAARALWSFLSDKEDTTSVIRVFRALDGARPERNFQRFETSALGRDVLAERRDLGAVLADRDALRALPDGSLGLAYLAFVERENIGVEGLRMAAETAMAGRRPLEPRRQLYRNRFRDMHDLWHVLTGYGREALGEIALLGFTYGQTRQRGFRIVARIWALKEQARSWSAPALACLGEGIRLGARACWMLEQDWERLLARPLDEVRATLNVTPPRRYLSVRERPPAR